MKKKQNKHRFRQITKILLRHKLQKGLTPIKVRETIEDLGPTYVKLGQIMSTREDMIPLAYCEELSKLKENVKPLSFDIVKEVIKDELQKPINQVFSSIESTPIGSASIGQVHIATLLNGEKVVVKIMRPHIYEIVEQDFKILKSAIKCLNLFTNLDEVVDLNIIFEETFEAMKLEMDFLNEQNNIKLFTKNNEDKKYIKLPKTYDEYTTSHMLVMEYISGYKIDDIETLINNGYDPKEICNKLVENFTEQVVDLGVFHADPHSGNILISDGKIVWLDLGMIGLISKKDRNLYKRAIKAVIRNDIYEIKSIILTIGVCRHEINHAKLYQDIENMMSKYLDMDINEMDMGILLQEVMSIALHNGISLPKGVTLLGRSIVIIQKIVANLNPNANLMDFFSAHVKDNYQEELDPKVKVPEIARKLYKSASKSAEIPAQVSDLLNLTIRGERHLNVEIVNLRENVNKAGRIVNRLIFGILIASMIFSITIVLTALLLKIKALWFSIVMGVLAGLGVICVIFFIVMLSISMLKERKK